ncbi:carbamate kinase [Metabacillus sp. GX 13764]|uniref:carbamate kinase n=1 Tax=Metabacillus kandeliae TaxID=2900151 RepID=UPI001E439C12|nr:carbamate kinase [Metabacillus kandeliae]MCD7035971.1 carbamate kinase [Metabacillus kandeliae]
MADKKVVVALGGNAIQTKCATAEGQAKALEKTAEQLVKLILDGFDLIFTHGNGPQVGNILLQQEAADSEETPAMPLDTCVAMSDGMIGYWVENALENAFQEHEIKREIATIMTRILVDQNDPDFDDPSKPIGPVLSEKDAKEKMKNSGVVYKEDAGKGWRRNVPSPKPKKIIGSRHIERLMEHDVVVIAGGGGGIPIVKENGRYRGIQAVIDKDYASELLAEVVDADYLLFLMDEQNVMLNFGEENQEAIGETTADELKKLLQDGKFAAGSMKPKVEAAISFVESKPNRAAIITSIEQGHAAIMEKKGTYIISDKK